MHKYLTIIFSVLTSAALAQSVKFKTYTMADLDDQPAATESMSLPKDSVKEAFFNHYRVYDDDIMHSWGLEYTSCKDFQEVDHVAKSGSTCLSLKWDQSKCPWVGWGTPWIGGRAMNFKGKEKTAALSFYMRSNDGIQSVPAMKVALEDGNQSNSYVDIGYRYFSGTEVNETWQQVLMPLAAFGMAGKGMDLTQIQQLIMSFDGKGHVLIDQIEIIAYEGKADNPFNKSKEELYPVKQAPSLELPFTVLGEHPPFGAWGFDTDAIKSVKVSGGTIDWEWNYGKGEGWVGWGFSLNELQVVDFSTVWKNAALTFTMEQITPAKTESPEIKIGFEDVYAHSTYIGLDPRYIKEDAFSGAQKVVIPLQDFYFDSKGVLLENIKQMIVYSNWYEKNQHHVRIKDMKIEAYDGQPSNPFQKERYDIFIAEDEILAEEGTGIEGAFVGGFITNNPLGTGKEWGLLTGRKPSCVMWYSDWSTEVDVELLQSVIDQGYTPHMVWEAMLDMEKRTGVTLDDILAGKFDPYIERSANAIKQLSGKIQIRIFHEFNGGTWYPWSPKVNGRELGAEKMKDAWRHVHDIFEKKVGAENVEWVFCFYKMDRVDGDVQHEVWNKPLAAYPGDEYVDWVGVDFYNYFPVYDEVWKDYKEQFAEQYVYMAENFPNKPIQISEFASNTDGGDKGQWFRDMNRDNQKLFPRLKLYNYFEINKEADWRLSSTPESQKAYQEIMKDPYNRSSSVGLNNVVTQYPQWVKSIGDSDLKAIAAYQAERDSIIRAGYSKYVEAKKSTTIDKAIGIKVDGQLQSGEWTSTSIVLSNGSTVQLAYDDKAIYLAGNIVDKNPLKNSKDNGEVWNGDAIEFALSLDHRADPYRAHFGDHDVHLAMKATKDPYLWSWKKNRKLHEAKVATASTDNGYSFEIMLPYSAVAMLELKPGKTYDFELAIDDGDGSERKQQIRWNSVEEGFYRYPYLWGEFQTTK